MKVDSMRLFRFKNGIEMMMKEYVEYVSPKSKTYTRYSSNLKHQYNAIKNAYNTLRKEAIKCLDNFDTSKNVKHCIDLQGLSLANKIDSFGHTLSAGIDEYTCQTACDLKDTTKIFTFIYTASDFGESMVSTLSNIGSYFWSDILTANERKHLISFLIDTRNNFPDYNTLITSIGRGDLKNL